MKELFKNGIIVLLIIGVLYIIFLRECKKEKLCPGKDEILVPLITWNKMQELANKPPVVRIETTFMKGPTIYIHDTPFPQPQQDLKDTTITNYADSVVNKNIDVHYDFKVQGTLLSRTWSYSPIIFYVRYDSTIYVPTIVEAPKSFKQEQNGLYGYGIAGGNFGNFLFGGGVDFITKKNTELGYLYQRFGTQNFHSFKLGIKLFSKN